MSGSETSISSEISDISSVSDDCDDSFNSVAGCYDCEPEYTEEELKKLKDKTHETSSSEDELESSRLENLHWCSEDELESSRLENLHWCSCKCCVIGLPMTLEECKCCKEFNILREKLENLCCVTAHPDFETLILAPSVLEVSFIRHRRYQGNFKDFTEMNTR